MFFATYAKEIVSALVPLILWVLNYATRNKVKLQFASPHEFTFLIDEPVRDANNVVIAPKQNVHTITWMINNAGSQPATNVEVVFNYKPRYLNIWPVRHYTEHTEKDDRFVLVFDTLAPKELIRLHAFTIKDQSPTLLNVRSDQAMGEQIAIWLYAKVAPWKIHLFRALALLGLGTTVYLLLFLLQFVVLRSPQGH